MKLATRRANRRTATACCLRIVSVVFIGFIEFELDRIYVWTQIFTDAHRSLFSGIIKHFTSNLWFGAKVQQKADLDIRCLQIIQ